MQPHGKASTAERVTSSAVSVAMQSRSSAERRSGRLDAAHRKHSNSHRSRRGTIPELARVQERDVLTNGGTTNGANSKVRRPVSTASGTQKVVIVNGSTDILELLETVLDAGHYDMVFVESSDHAYSQIKRVQPNLVILCVRIDDDGRLPGPVDAEARRGDARHSGADLHDRVRRAGPRKRRPRLGRRDVRLDASAADELTRGVATRLRQNGIVRPDGAPTIRRQSLQTRAARCASRSSASSTAK